MAIEDRIYEKSVEYLSDIPELADEKPSKLLIGCITTFNLTDTSQLIALTKRKCLG